MMTYAEEDTQPMDDSEVEKKKHSVLVIEDNEELLQLMTILLKREYNVFTAENGKEGISVLENEDIDLIVSDVMMPEMDGIEFCKYVKSNLEISHIPVILLTAKIRRRIGRKLMKWGRMLLSANHSICRCFMHVSVIC